MSEKHETTRPRFCGTTTEAAMRACCGPMLEWMSEVFGESAEDPGGGSATKDDDRRADLSCLSMMERMSSRCCGPAPKQPATDE